MPRVSHIALAAGAVLVGLAGSANALDLEPGKVLTFHSSASGDCPGLDWHIVIGASNKLTGMLAWDDMQHIVRVTGTADQDGNFRLAFQPTTGETGYGNIEGQFPDHNGWLTARVTNAGCPLQNVSVEWYRTPYPSGE